MDDDKLEAQPLLGFRLLKNPDRPGLAVLVLNTANGDNHYFVHGKALKEMSKVFRSVAPTLASLTEPK